MCTGAVQKFKVGILGGCRHYYNAPMMPLPLHLVIHYDFLFFFFCMAVSQSEDFTIKWLLEN